MLRKELGRRSLVGGLAALAAQPALAAVVPRPQGYPRSYDRLIETAARERQLVIYSSTDPAGFVEILRAFRALYPFLTVRYEDLPANDVYSRLVGEASARKVVVDFLMNSAMDQQIKLVNDGYAQPYASPEKPHLPEWAVWKNEAYAVSAEPVVFAYNRRLMPAGDVPRSHTALQSLLERKRAAYTGKVALYDPAASSTGFLYITQDVQLDHGTWGLLRAIGRTHPKAYNSTDEMIHRVQSGEHLLAYNMIGSYALAEQRKDPNFRVVIPQDYALVASRIAVIAKDAPHPAAAKLFLDFLLSRAGQALLARQHMAPLRRDVAPIDSAINPNTARAIRVGPALLASLDQLTRANFLREWRRALAG